MELPGKDRAGARRGTCPGETLSLWLQRSLHLDVSGGLPWWSSGEDSVLPLQEEQVQSLVGKLRSYMPWSKTKKKIKIIKIEIRKRPALLPQASYCQGSPLHRGDGCLPGSSLEQRSPHFKKKRCPSDLQLFGSRNFLLHVRMT